MDSQELQRIKNKYDIVGNDAALSHAIETAMAVAPTDLTVLITGESGAGIKFRVADGILTVVDV